MRLRLLIRQNGLILLRLAPSSHILLLKHCQVGSSLLTIFVHVGLFHNSLNLAVSGAMRRPLVHKVVSLLHVACLLGPALLQQVDALLIARPSWMQWPCVVFQ